MILSYLFFFANIFLNWVNFSNSFHPITVQNYAVTSKPHLLVRPKIRDWLKCIVKCQNHSKCLSYNYRHRQKRAKGPLCELYECGLDQRKDLKHSLYYSSGMIFQQLKPAKDGQYCKKVKKSSPGQGCRSGWIPHGTSCYKPVKTILSWQNANSNCQNMKSNLTSVVNQDQNNFLVSLSTEFTRRYFWIGFVWSNAAASFEWEDGSLSTYVNWGDGEPTNTTSYYDCVNIKKSDGKWKNWDCLTENPSVCKYDRPVAE